MTIEEFAEHPNGILYFINRALTHQIADSSPKSANYLLEVDQKSINCSNWCNRFAELFEIFVQIVGTLLPDSDN